MADLDTRKRDQSEIDGVLKQQQKYIPEKRTKADIDESVTSDSASSDSGEVLDRTQKIAQAYRTILEVITTFLSCNGFYHLFHTTVPRRGPRSRRP